MIINIFENVQKLIDILNMEKKNEETFFLLEIIASELAALYCLY